MKSVPMRKMKARMSLKMVPLRYREPQSTDLADGCHALPLRTPKACSFPVSSFAAPYKVQKW